MATTTTTTSGKSKCIKCDQDRSTVKCSRCTDEFYSNHLVEHRQELNKQLDDIKVYHDVFQQTLHQQNNPLIQQIDQWEQNSIEKIRQTAEEARQVILRITATNNTNIKEQLNKLTNEFEKEQKDDNINEINLQNWKEQLKKLSEQFTKPSNVIIIQNSVS